MSAHILADILGTYLLVTVVIGGGFVLGAMWAGRDD